MHPTEFFLSSLFLIDTVKYKIDFTVLILQLSLGICQKVTSYNKILLLCLPVKSFNTLMSNLGGLYVYHPIKFDKLAEPHVSEASVWICVSENFVYIPKRVWLCFNLLLQKFIISLQPRLQKSGDTV